MNNSICFLRIVIIIAVLFPVCQPYAQQLAKFPVSVTSSIAPPYAVYLEDFFKSGGGGWQAQVNFLDLNTRPREVYFRGSIEGNSATIVSGPSASAYRFTLTPGIPLFFSPEQLGHFFDPSDLIASGISHEKLQQSGFRLPEGQYDFCLEIIDYLSGVPLSRKTCVPVWLQYQDEPLIISPACGSVVDPSIAGIQFQWQLGNTIPPNSRMEYKLSIYHVLPGATDPLNALRNGQAVLHHSSPYRTEAGLYYDMSQPVFEKGSLYAFVVEARDANGNTFFKNDGVSEVCWFSYGYPINGKINIASPENGYSFKKGEIQLLKWKAPDNLLKLNGSPQTFNYELKIALLEGEEDPEAALKKDSVWYHYKSPVTTDRQGADLELKDKKLAPGERYAWQVLAFTGDHQIAASEIFLVSGGPFIEEFYVNKHRIRVTESTTKTLEAFAGRGIIELHPEQMNGPTQVEVTFRNLKIEDIGGRKYLLNGAIHQKLHPPISFTLAPKEKTNGPAEIYITEVMYSKQSDRQVKVVSRLRFPHATPSDAIAYITSDSVWVPMPERKILGKVNLKAAELRLLDPLNFRLKLDSVSQLFFRGKNYELNIQGSIAAPRNVEGVHGEVALPFQYASQFHFIENDIENSPESFYDNSIRLAAQLPFLIRPGRYMIDLSESESPEGINPQWKGVYFSRYKFEMHPFQDPASGIENLQTLEKTIFVTGEEVRCLITPEGLDFHFDHDFTTSFENFTINGFYASLKKFSIRVKGSMLHDSQVLGNVNVPFLGRREGFGFTVPLTKYGFNQAYLNEESVRGYTFTFNEQSNNEKIVLTIEQAVFRNKDRIDITFSNLEWPHLSLRLSGLTQFFIYGNNDIGFGAPGGVIALGTRPRIEVAHTDMVLTHIGAGRDCNMYSFGFAAEMNLGEEITGINGPPETNLFSICQHPSLQSTACGPVVSKQNNSIYGNKKSIFEDDDSYQETTVSRKASAEKLVRDQVGKINNSFSLEKKESDNKGFVFDPLNDPVAPDSLKQSLTFDQVIQIMEFLADHIVKDNRSDLVRVLNVFKGVRERYAEEIKTLEQSGTAGEFAKKLLKNAIDEKIREISGPMDTQLTELNQKIEGFIMEPTNEAVDALNKQFDALMAEATGRLIAAVEPHYPDVVPAIQKAKEALATTVKNEVKNRVTATIKTEVSDRITMRLDSIVRKRTVAFVDSTLTRLVYSVIEGKGEHTKAEASAVLDDARLLFKGMGQDIKKAITEDGNTIKGIAANIGTHVIDSLMPEVTAQLKDIAMKGVDAAGQKLLEEGMNKAVDWLADDVFANHEVLGDVTTSLAASVDLNFSNIRNKKLYGKDGVIHFDYTNIDIKTSYVDVKGTLNHITDDETWGDSWQGEVVAAVKKPKNITLKAAFVKGTTSEKLSYWFVELAAPAGLNIPMGPMILDGIGGKVFRHMAFNVEKKTYLPDPAINYGAGLDLYGMDASSTGKTFRFKLTAEATFHEDYFAFDMRGETGIGFAESGGRPPLDKAKIYGPGYLTYNSKNDDMLGEFKIITNTSPLLCATGSLGIDIKGSKYWRFYAGSRQEPITTKLLCLDQLKISNWFDLSNERLETGFEYDLDLSVEAPWIGAKGFKIKPYAHARFYLLALADLQLNPEFRINEAQVDLEAMFAIGAKWKALVTDGDWKLAGAYLAGTGRYSNTTDGSCLFGRVAGSVSVLGMSIGADFDVNHCLASRNSIN